MSNTSTPEITRGSQRTLGLAAVIFAVMLWAVAVNLIHNLFEAGVNPFELVVSSMTSVTFGLAVVNSFRRKPEAKAMSR